MKGHEILRRIKEIEKEFDTSGFQLGTTKIDPNCLTSPERKLLHKQHLKLC